MISNTVRVSWASSRTPCAINFFVLASFRADQDRCIPQEYFAGPPLRFLILLVGHVRVLFLLLGQGMELD
jgi:hypothetical protein